jgi:hypothetical protein
VDPPREYVFKSITTEDGHRFVERVRLFAAGELEHLCTEAGCTVRHRLGDYDGAPLAPDSPRVILVAEVA